MPPARIGFIGLGAVAQVHAQAYSTCPDLEVVAVHDADPARLDAFATEHGAKAYSNLGEMLDSASLDVACVLTPARTHESVVLACAKAGVDVLCEKPLALAVDACDRMISACEQAGITLGYGASYRYLPAITRAKAMIEAGDIGDILVMRESVVGGAGPTSRATMSPAHYPAGGPGGSGMGLIDHGVHLIDLFSWLSGAEVTRVVGRGNRAEAPQLPEYLLLEFEGGAIGELVYEDGTFPTELPTEGIFSRGHGWDPGGPTLPGKWQAHPGSIHVHGTRGALRIFHYANALFLRDATGLRQIHVPEDGAPIQFALQMRAFLTALRERKPAPVPPEAGREACRLVMSVYG